MVKFLRAIDFAEKNLYCFVKKICVWVRNCKSYGLWKFCAVQYM